MPVLKASRGRMASSSFGLPRKRKFVINTRGRAIAAVAYAKKLARAETLDAYSQLVTESFRMRRDCLRIVEGMTRDEYSLGRAAESAAEKTKDARRKMKEKFPGE